MIQRYGDYQKIAINGIVDSVVNGRELKGCFSGGYSYFYQQNYSFQRGL